MLRDEVKVKLDIWRGLWGTNGLKAAPALVFQIGLVKQYYSERESALHGS
jgi:hypothetical protein